MSQRLLAAVAALYCLLAVMLAALGSHVLPTDSVTAQKLWGTALQIHMFHAAALLALAALAHVRNSFAVSWSGLVIALGVLLFSASLYLRAAGIFQLAGLITPLGGGIIMLGWIILIMILVSKTKF